jgi:hypothetical protein
MAAKTNVKDGAIAANHNEAQVHSVGLKVQTSVKAGGVPCPPPRGKGEGKPNC